jgi:hypothetical protein
LEQDGPASKGSSQRIICGKQTGRVLRQTGWQVNEDSEPNYKGTASTLPQEVTRVMVPRAVLRNKYAILPGFFCKYNERKCELDEDLNATFYSLNEISVPLFFDLHHLGAELVVNASA